MSEYSSDPFSEAVTAAAAAFAVSPASIAAFTSVKSGPFNSASSSSLVFGAAAAGFVVWFVGVGFVAAWPGFLVSDII